MSKEDTTGSAGLGEIVRRLSDLFDHLVELKEGDAPQHGRREKNGMVFEYSFGRRTAAEARDARGGGPRPRPSEPPHAQAGRTAAPRTTKPSGTAIMEPVTDIFDEPDEIQLLFELPGVARKDIHCVLDGDILVVEATAGERRYRKETLIETPLANEEPHLTMRNGVLQVRLKKQKATKPRKTAKTK